MIKRRSDCLFDYDKYAVEGGWNIPCPECGKERFTKHISNARRALKGKTQCRSCGQRKPLHEHKTSKSLSPAWSKAVKERYNNQCAVCFSTQNLEAHHIFPRRTWEVLALSLNNGVCLCSNCHKEFHSLNGKKQIK